MSQPCNTQTFKPGETCLHALIGTNLWSNSGLVKSSIINIDINIRHISLLLVKHIIRQAFMNRTFIVIHALELDYGLVKIVMLMLFKGFFFPTSRLSILISFKDRQMGREIVTGMYLTYVC